MSMAAGSVETFHNSTRFESKFLALARTIGSCPQRGLGTLIPVLVIIGVASVLMTTWVSSSRQALAQTDRLRLGLQAMEVSRSAVAEAHLNLQRAVNDPRTPTFAAFRTPGGLARGQVVGFPDLVHTYHLPGADRFDVRVLATVESYRPTSPWSVDAAGLLRITVQVKGPGGTDRSLARAWAFRTQRITFPPPLDRWVIGPRPSDSIQLFGTYPGSESYPEDPQIQLLDTDEGEETYRLITMPETFEKMAAYRVDGGKGPGALQAWFERGLGRPGAIGAPRRLNGIVFVNGRDGTTQRLAGLRFRGKALLVVDGKLSLDDVTVGDKGEDLLSVICYDTVTASGKLELSLLRVHRTSDIGTGHEPSSGSADIHGSLLDVTGIDTQDFRGSVSANRLALSGRDGAPLPSQIVVLISPLGRPGVARRG